eukprot:GHVH01001560.1.p1 GENE.GHVH01001560.1~~GHVH01001560.1.p1  ORF type:complete len:626 (+),score=86.32 GHVH01001560.1:185-2062(+)
MGVVKDEDLDLIESIDIPHELKLKFHAMFNAGYTGQTYYDYLNENGREDTLTIIHFNDVYNVDPDTNGQGGFPRFATALRRHKEKHPLIFFSGDAFSPSMISTMLRGRQMVPFLNSVQITTACVGNHDWDFGLDDFETLAGSTYFPWVLSNLLDSNEHVIGGTQRYHIFEHQGYKIGVIGLIEYEWLETISLIDLNELIYTDFIKAAKALVQLLKYKGVELIIALTHMRAPNDEKLASEVDGLDLILGGHDHHYAGMHSMGGTVVGKSGTDFREFSVLTIQPGVKDSNVDESFQSVRGCLNADEDPKDGHSLVPQSGAFIMPEFAGGSTLRWERVDCQNMQPNSHVQLMVDKFTSKIEASMGQKMGAFNTLLEARFSHIRTRETNTGSFLCDLMRMFTQSDVALLNSGTLRADCQIQAFETFTLRRLVQLLPYPDELVVLELTGSKLIETLECGYCMYPKLEGRFLQVAGVSLTMDPSKSPGSRVSDVKIRRWKQDEFEPIQPANKYKVIVKQYMAQGKDGFDCLLGSKVLVDPESTPVLPTMLSNQFEYLAFINDEKKPQVQSTMRQIAKIRNLPDDVLKDKGFAKIDDKHYLSAHVGHRIDILSPEATPSNDVLKEYGFSLGP